ncbi:MAG TPA: hypothetical protein VGG61_09120 [Gemmataceae bacterium]
MKRTQKLVTLPKPPAPPSEPGADFEKHHFLLEAPGRRVALDLFTRVTDITPKRVPSTAPKSVPRRRGKRP